MKYMLDIALIVGMLWIGWMWNAEKQNGLSLSDEMDTMKAQVAQLQLDVKKATEESQNATTSLETVQKRLEETGKELLNKTDALNAKTEEAGKLKAGLAKAVARVKELEGYKAKAIVAEMPKPVTRTP